MIEYIKFKSGYPIRLPHIGMVPIEFKKGIKF
jgi:hypothetical protein